MQDLKVTLIQSELVWEDIGANLSEFDDRIAAIKEDTHLIILPEMFSTGFSMNAVGLAQDMTGSAVQWLRKKSSDIHTDIVGSIMINDQGKYYNRLIWAKPEGDLFTYDKRHLFRMAGEEKVYSAGSKTITVKLNDWHIRPFICYDLRFPAWTRNMKNQYDAAIFIANWPERRAEHWKVLLQARAVENQCYVLGVNRVGTDGNGLTYSGDSSIIDPWGTVIFQKSNQPVTYSTQLSYELLKRSREGFPVWMDADHDIIRLP
ncbi:MAG: amidohydrolase [Desulfobacterales bacterium]